MVKERVAPYEEARNRTIEENKKKLEALNLHHLSHEIKKLHSSKTQLRNKLKKPKVEVTVTPRRSHRLANLHETKSLHELGDRNKPKRPPSAFFVFMEEFRKAFKKKNSNNKLVSVVGKNAVDKWKTLSEAEKASYVAKANKLQSEYNNKMNAYNKKPADDDEEEFDKPKRPPGAFFVFMEEFRKTFKEQNPNNKLLTVVGKAGGDKWRTLSEAEKAPYVAKNKMLQSEYNNKMNAYNKKQAELRKKPADDDEVEFDKPKRPPSAFFVFMKEFRKTFKEQNPNNKLVSVVGKAGSDKWKTLSEAEKAPYVAKIKKLQSEYNNKMNAYNKKHAETRKKAADDDEEESDKSKSEVNDD